MYGRREEKRVRLRSLCQPSSIQPPVTPLPHSPSLLVTVSTHTYTTHDRLAEACTPIHRFHDTLPASIHARKDKHVTHEELVQITKWKLTRGKNRRQLLDLVRINTELAVKQTTQKAFRKIPNLGAAISALTNLKGIGPQTASAVLCAGFPDHCP